MNGGEGNDVLYFHNTEKAEKPLIAADKDNTVTGNDTIGISATTSAPPLSVVVVMTPSSSLLLTTA